MCLFHLMCSINVFLPAKAVPEMTYTVSGETLNPTHSLCRFYNYAYLYSPIWQTNNNRKDIFM